MKHFENISMVQSPVYGFKTIISALWAQSKAAISVPLSSQSHDVWVHIIFASLLCLFLLGVLKQPSWPHLKEEEGDTYPKASLHEEAAQGDKSPLWAPSPSVSNNSPFFPAWLNSRWEMFHALEQAFVESCLTPRVSWWGCWGEEKPRMSGSPWWRTHSLCPPDPLRFLPGPFWPLSHFSAQMWKLLHTASRDLDSPS